MKDYSILYWIEKNQIKNEKGDRIEFNKHLFLADIYADQSQFICVTKAAQVGVSSLEILKNFWDAHRFKMDIIYILPTDQDVQIFVGGKVNRFIAQNPILSSFTKDKDSIEQKQVGESMVYFRGSFTKKSAIMVTADRLSMDEKDSCKQDILSDYQSRLQHSKYSQIHTFSHPSLPDFGISEDWNESDQKCWHILCSRCGHRQFLNWNTENDDEMSIDLEKEIYVCKKCKKELSEEDRRVGEWVKKYENKKFSGYWVPLLVAPWVSAKDIVKKYRNPQSSQEFFYNKVLGLPFLDSQAKLGRHQLFANLTNKQWSPTIDQRVVLGIDTGLRLDYVVGNEKGLFHHGDCDDYGELDEIMKRWQRAIAVIDQGGDIIAARKFYERWRGRVFLCNLTGDRKGKELVKWGENDEEGSVLADRDRVIQIVVGEFKDKRIPLHGTENDWYEFWTDWKNLSRIKITDTATGALKGYKWVRSGRDHRAMSSIFYRVGMTRFGWGMADIAEREKETMSIPIGINIQDGKTRAVTPEGNSLIEETLKELREGERDF